MFIVVFHCVVHPSGSWTFDPYCMTIVSRELLYHTFHNKTVTACVVIRKQYTEVNWQTSMDDMDTKSHIKVFISKQFPSTHKIVNDSGPFIQEQMLAPMNNYPYIPVRF